MNHRQLASSAAKHHGVLLPTVLDDLGISTGQRRRRVATGEWHRLPNGILVLAATPHTFAMRCTAALAALPEAALSHQSAIRVLGTRTDDDRVHLAIQAGRATRAPGAVLHQTWLPASDVTVRNGLRVTKLERTLVDLGATMGREELQRCIEDYLVARRTTLARIEATFVRLARPGRTGIGRVRGILSALDGQPPHESELEAMFSRLVARYRLPTPVRQQPVDWSKLGLEWMTAAPGRVDCWYETANLIVELDGRTFHGRLAAFEEDRRRDQAALVHGIRTVRFTHRQITDEPDWVVGVLRALLDESLPTNPCEL